MNFIKKDLEDKILSISKESTLSHIGSNLSCLPVLIEIYEKKALEDLVILDNAHAHLAHLAIMQKYNIMPEHMIAKLIKDYGIHCDKYICDASGGSLGHGLGIAIGRALVRQPWHERLRDIYVIVSEGSMMEGSSWEALRIIGDLKLKNIHIYTNFNGWSAVASVSGATLMRRMSTFLPFINYRFTKNGKGYEGLQGHYCKVK